MRPGDSAGSQHRVLMIIGVMEEWHFGIDGLNFSHWRLLIGSRVDFYQRRQYGSIHQESGARGTLRLDLRSRRNSLRDIAGLRIMHLFALDRARVAGRLLCRRRGDGESARNCGDRNQRKLVQHRSS